jgi:hypothetical protein
VVGENDCGHQCQCGERECEQRATPIYESTELHPWPPSLSKTGLSKKEHADRKGENQGRHQGSLSRQSQATGLKNKHNQDVQREANNETHRYPLDANRSVLIERQQGCVTRK